MGCPCASPAHPPRPGFISKYRNHQAPPPSPSPTRKNQTSYLRRIGSLVNTSFSVFRRGEEEHCDSRQCATGAPEAVIDTVVAGVFQLPFQLSREAFGVKQVLRKYRDRRIDLADACLICLADEFETANILTWTKTFRSIAGAEIGLSVFWWR